MNEQSIRKMGFWEKVNAHLDNVAFYQTVFSLPFAYIAAMLAADGHPDIMTMFWITMTIFAARSAALALDNYFDYKYDKHQPRMKSRPMHQGRIDNHDVYILLVICFVVLIFSVLQLKPVCIKLLPLAAIPFIIYPFMKRITCLCHYMCGFAVSMAPAGGWVAVTGTIDWPMIVLCVAVTLWIGGFDMAYGAQDEEFDKSQGLHSMAVTLGAAKAMQLARLTHMVCLGLFIYFGMLFELGIVYYIGVAVAAVTLWYQHHIISPTDFSAISKKYYQRNGIVSVAIFVCTLISVLLK